jgi:hypothetical protein
MRNMVTIDSEEMEKCLRDAKAISLKFAKALKFTPAGWNELYELTSYIDFALNILMKGKPIKEEGVKKSSLIARRKMKIIKFEKKNESLKEDREIAIESINSYEKFLVIYMREDGVIGWNTNFTIRESIVASSIYHHETQMQAFEENECE